MQRRLPGEPERAGPRVPAAGRAAGGGWGTRVGEAVGGWVGVKSFLRLLESATRSEFRSPFREEGMAGFR